MDIRQLADRLGDYKIKGNEIVFDLCPYCHGGDHRDKFSAAMNVEVGAFNCKRGSCGKQLSFKQVCEDFGYKTDFRSTVGTTYSRPAKLYKPPVTPIKPLTTATEQYLTLRKINCETQKAYRIGTDEHGNIIFPFYENRTDEKPVFLKFRPSHKVQAGERKSWRDSDTKPILFGMWLCKPDKPLCIFEGEIDAMSGYESGIPNCVSIPSGCEDLTFLDTCYDFIKQFEAIYLFGDNDAPGREMQQKLSTIFSEDHRVYLVEHDYKDANELLFRKGSQAVKTAYDTAHELPVYGLIDLATVTPLDVKHISRVGSGLKALDAKIGGFPLGECTILTGRRGEGKSTFAGQLALSAVNQSQNVCLYSGEMRSDRVQYWLNLQAAGTGNIENYHDTAMNRNVYSVKNPVLEKIKAWYAGKFFLYDNSIAGANESDSILKVFTYAVKRYNCKFMVIDNLMTCNYSGSDRDFYRQQSSLVGEFVNFAKHFNVHVLICAHPRKSNGSLSNDDISGSSDITNRVDNVFALEKLSDEAKAAAGCDAILSILKNRGDGATGKIGLDFDPVSRRLYVPSEGQLNYGWQNIEVAPAWIEAEVTDELPY
jgi:twinkle protein